VGKKEVKKGEKGTRKQGKREEEEPVV